jgi:type I restriction enzyme S subunit
VVKSGKYPKPTANGRPYFRRFSGELLIGRQNLHNLGLGIVKSETDGLIASNAISSFTGKDGNVSFLHQLMSAEIFQHLVNNSSSGTGQKEISEKQILQLHVTVPPLPEQKKIASILTSVDEVIENTQKQIDKLQDFKKATMNQLLTKGIGHTEFMDSELGRIPKSWEIRFLDDVTQRGSGHTPAKQNPSYWNGGIKWVSLADSSRLDNGFIYETDKEISEDGLANSSAVLHPKGTVVLSRDAGVGKSSVLAEEMAVSQHFMAWRCENLIDSWFLYYWMQKAKPIFEAVAIGSTIKTIGLGYFKQLKMAYPPFEEQKSIAAKLLSIDEHIDKLKDKLSQTQSLKKSLMQDLLTGKVRVTVN